ncbi:MAG: sigma factor-like helix-turn-helix DNA-binding protein, partial [Myxococcales bacterium]
RTVVVLHDVEELSIAEIAGIVGSNELTVRSRLRDGRKRLRVLLSADQEFPLKPRVSPERAA